jgi:hypothetical protein
MPIDLARKMISVAAAVAADDGAAVLELARAYLGEVVSLDAGEVALRRDSRLECEVLAGAAPGLATADLLDHLSRRNHVLRFDEIHELADLPGAQAAMKERSLRSLLVLPVAHGAVALGAVVLGAQKPYAFVGVSQRTFGPLMAMVGVSFAKALELSAAARRPPVGKEADHEGCQEQAAKLRTDLDRAQASLSHCAAELQQARQRQARCQEESGQLARDRDALRVRLAEVDDAFALAARVEDDLAREREALTAARDERDRLAQELAAARKLHRTEVDIDQSSPISTPAPVPPTGETSTAVLDPPVPMPTPVVEGAKDSAPPPVSRSRKRHRRR